MNTLEELTDAIKQGRHKDTKQFTQELLAENTAPKEILEALITGMDDITRRFKTREIFIPEVLFAARAMKTAMELLEPKLTKAGLQAEHKVVIGTVKGDLHDIGKNLVVMMFKGANFEVIDLGVDVPAEKFVEAVKESGAELVMMSALLTTTMPAMREVLDEFKLSGLSVKTMVGGAPVTQDFATEIGADGYADDAASAVDVARELVGA